MGMGREKQQVVQLAALDAQSLRARTAAAEMRRLVHVPRRTPAAALQTHFFCHEIAFFGARTVSIYYQHRSPSKSSFSASLEICKS